MIKHNGVADRYMIQVKNTDKWVQYKRAVISSSTSHIKLSICSGYGS